MPAHVPDGVERFGRRMKMEYVGMASVFLTIWLLHFESVVALAAMFFLFVALKKKTRDHLVTSFLMFAAAALAVPAVRSTGKGGLTFALFAMLAWALEGWLEKRPGRIVTIPFVLGALGATTPAWPVAVLFSSAYLLEPRPDAPHLRRRLAWLEAAGLVLALGAALFVARSGGAAPLISTPPTPRHLAIVAAVAAPAALALVVFWRSLAAPHRWNALVSGALAPFDHGMVAVFAIAATIVLAATVFRQSVDSPVLRPHFKRAEWYYFWAILAVALGLTVSRYSVP